MFHNPFYIHKIRESDKDITEYDDDCVRTTGRLPYKLVRLL